MLLGGQGKRFVPSPELNVNAFFNWDWDRFAPQSSLGIAVQFSVVIDVRSCSNVIMVLSVS